MIFAFYQKFKLHGFASFLEGRLAVINEPPAPVELSVFVNLINEKGASLNSEAFDPKEKKSYLAIQKLEPSNPNFPKAIKQQAAIHNFFAIIVPDSMQKILIELESKKIEEQQKIEILNGLADATDQEQEDMAEFLNDLPKE